MEKTIEGQEKRDDFKAKKYPPVDHNNDAEMVKAFLRVPKLVIDYKVFKKNDAERLKVSNAKSRWLSQMRIKFPGVSKKLLSGHNNRYPQMGI